MKRLLTVAVGALFLCVLSHGPVCGADEEEKKKEEKETISVERDNDKTTYSIGSSRDKDTAKNDTGKA